MSSKNRNTLDIRKGQFFNNPPSLYVKGSKEEGRSGTRLSKPISASIGPWIFPSKDSVETSGSFLPPPVSRRSITTVLYLSGGGHRDRLSTSNQRRVEDKRAKKSWSKNRGGDAGLLLFSIRYFKRKQIVLLLLLLRSSSPSQINPRSSQYAVFPTFGLLSRRSTRQLGLLRVRSMKIKLGLVFFSFFRFFFARSCDRFSLEGWIISGWTFGVVHGDMECERKGEGVKWRWWVVAAVGKVCKLFGRVGDGV